MVSPSAAALVNGNVDDKREGDDNDNFNDKREGDDNDVIKTMTMQLKDTDSVEDFKEGVVARQWWVGGLRILRRRGAGVVTRN